MPRYDLTITVNFPNDTEAEFDAAGQTQFSEIGKMVEFAMLANGGLYTSRTKVRLI